MNLSHPLPGRVRVLHVEDDGDDCETVRRLLVAGGLDVDCRRVARREEFVSALRTEPVDAILSDMALTQFDGMSALRIAQELAPETPFLFVSRTAGEAAAVEALRLGADDYLLKDRLANLATSLRRALDACGERRRRRDAEARLQESEERFRRFMEASPILAFMRDEAGRYVFANRAVCEFVGRTEEQILGSSIEDLFPAATARAMQFGDDDVLSGGRHVEASVPVPAQDGTLRQLSIVKFPLRDVSGHRLVAGIALDVTEKKQLEERYLHAQKLEAVGRLAGGVAHDFNNLLTVITGYTQMLESARGSDPVLRTYVSEIRAAADRAAVLTRQLLAFSRQEVVQPVVLSPNDVIAGIERMVRRLVGEEVRLDVELAPSNAAVRIDRGQLEQVVMNLVVNARDATQPGGAITVRTLVVPWARVPAADDSPPARCDHLLLSVADDGSGMSTETRARIFEPFFTTKGPGKGTGLGLATVHGIVKQAGGHILVRSALGTGSTFDVYFPVVDAPLAQPATAPAEKPADGGDETILVVEDSPPVRSLVTRILVQRGYKVLEAEDGVDAVERLRGHGTPIHLLVTDLVMPRMGGPGLAQAITELQPGCRILFLSGYADHESARRVDVGAGRALLRKPFTAVDLLHNVRALLDA